MTSKMKAFSTRIFSHQWLPAAPHVPREAQKVMIVLHGRGDSLRSFRSIREELDIPEMNYLLLNAPRGYDDGYSWYAFEPNQGRGILQAREKLRQLMNELELAGWKSTDVFFFGFSQGCVVSVDFALHYIKSLGGVIGISGYVFFFPNWKKAVSKAAFQTPLLITHGFFDDVIPLEGVRHNVDELHAARLPIEFREFNKDHGIDDEIEIPFIRSWVMKFWKSKSARRPFKRASRSLPQTRSIN